MTASDLTAADVESLLAVCRQDGRVCLIPKAWERLWHLLPEKTQTNGKWHPSLPLILDGWHYSSDAQKTKRMEEHIRWGADHGALADIRKFLTGLPADQWHAPSSRC